MQALHAQTVGTLATCTGKSVMLHQHLPVCLRRGGICAGSNLGASCLRHSYCTSYCKLAQPFFMRCGNYNCHAVRTTCTAVKQTHGIHMWDSALYCGVRSGTGALSAWQASRQSRPCVLAHCLTSASWSARPRIRAIQQCMKVCQHHHILLLLLIA